MSILRETAADDAFNSALEALDTQAGKLRKGTAQLKLLLKNFNSTDARPVPSQISALGSLAGDIKDALDNVERVREELAALRAGK